MDPDASSRWRVISEAEMLALGARRVTALESVGTIVLLAFSDGSTLKYDSGGELSNFTCLEGSRHVLADGRPVLFDGRFYVGDFQPES